MRKWIMDGGIWGCLSISSERMNLLSLMQSLSKRITVMILICIILIIGGCGAGGGTGPTSSSIIVTFTPEAASPGNNTVYMAENSSLSSGDILAIDVTANNISGNVFGAAFNVDFDSSKITYQDYIRGSFLGSESEANIYAGLEQGNANRVVVGGSRISGTVSGSGTIITLKFKAVAAGSTTIDFSGNNLLDSSDNIVSVNNWYGGTVTVQ